MCLFCNWAGLFGGAESRSDRRRVMRGAGAFMATGVVAPSPAFPVDKPASKSRAPSPNDGKADWLFQNGKIHTVNSAQPDAEAVVVRGTQIVYVGDMTGAMAWKGRSTRVVDLAGRMLMPGFIDSHNHLATLGVTKLDLNISGVVGKERVLKAVGEYVAGQPANATLRGFGWLAHSTFG